MPPCGVCPEKLIQLNPEGFNNALLAACCGVKVEPASYPIHCAVQSAGASSPMDHCAEVLQADTLLLPSYTRTCQKHCLPLVSGWPAYKMSTVAVLVTLPLSHKSALPVTDPT